MGPSPSARTFGTRRSNRKKKDTADTVKLDKASQVSASLLCQAESPPKPPNSSRESADNPFGLRKCTVRLVCLTPAQILAATGKNPEKRSDESAENVSVENRLRIDETSPKASSEPIDDKDQTTSQVHPIPSQDEVIEIVSTESQTEEATAGSEASNSNENQTEGSQQDSSPQKDLTIDALFKYLEPRAAKCHWSSTVLLADILQRDDVFIILMERRREILNNEYLMKNHTEEELFQMMLNSLQALIQGELHQLTCSYHEVLNLFN